MALFRRGIYAILDTGRLGWTTAELLAGHRDLLVAYGKAAADAGACALQLRCKDLPPGDAELAAAYGALLEALGARLPVLVNDDVETVVACRRALGHDVRGLGVHLGQDDASPAATRRKLGPEALIGWSTHDLRQVKAAAKLPVDYVGFGPVRASVTKSGHAEPTGLDGLRAACAASTVPVVAVGGLDVEDMPAVKAAGAHAAAVIGAWLGPPDFAYPPVQAGVALAGLVARWVVGATPPADSV